MPTTSNFGWTTPADTDLVKDGAAAIRTLGNGIDTSLVGLKGGTTGQILSKTSNTDLAYTWINNDQGDITAVTAGTGISGGGTTGAVTITNDMATTIDAKGDLIVGTGADAYARLAVGGTNGHVLQVDSTAATGMKWAAAPTSSANFTQISSTALSGTDTTISGISNYNTLYIFVASGSTGTANNEISVRFNSDTGTNYALGAWEGQDAANDTTTDLSATKFRLGRMGSATSNTVSGGLMIMGANTTSAYKPIIAIGGGTGTTKRNYGTFGWYKGTSTISSVTINGDGGTFDAGTVYVFGSTI